MTLDEIIREARRLDEAATKGPWDTAKVATLAYGDGFVASVPGREGDVLCEYAISAPGEAHVPAETGEHDAAFIAFARTALPMLARVAEAAVEMRAALEAYCKDNRVMSPAAEPFFRALAAFDRAARGDE